MKLYKKTLMAMVLAFLAAITVGCGDNDDLNQISGLQGANPNIFIGQFTGASNVATNQTGVLNLTTNANGNANGTLVVGAVNPQTTAPVGTYNVSGSFDPTTGTFTVTGSIPNFGNFTITGTLPTTTTQGSYTFTINNQTFNGAIQAASLGTPSVPGSGNNGGGNNGGGNSQIIQGGTINSLNFQTSQNFNGTLPNENSVTISGALAENVNGVSSLTILLSEVISLQEIRTFAITVSDPSGEPIEQGDTFSTNTNGQTGQPQVAVALSEGAAGMEPSEGYSLIEQTSGTVQVTSLTANSVTVVVDFDNLGPNTEITNNPSVGMFDVQANITGNFANIPQ